MLMWLPQIIKSLGALTDIQVGFLSSVPPLLGVAGTILASRSSDRSGDRKMHIAVLYTIGAIGMLASAFAPSPIWAYVCLCVAGLGINSTNSLFWSLNASFMTGIAAAASIAAVNTVAQFGGLIGPWLIGLVKDFDRKLHAGAGDCRLFSARRRHDCSHHAGNSQSPGDRRAPAAGGWRDREPCVSRRHGRAMTLAHFAWRS